MLPKLTRRLPVPADARDRRAAPGPARYGRTAPRRTRADGRHGASLSAALGRALTPIDVRAGGRRDPDAWSRLSGESVRGHHRTDSRILGATHQRAHRSTRRPTRTSVTPRTTRKLPMPQRGDSFGLSATFQDDQLLFGPFVLSRASALLVAAAVVAGAQGLQIPQPTGYVNDFAHVIPAANAATIDAHHRRRSRQVRRRDRRRHAARSRRTPDRRGEPSHRSRVEGGDRTRKPGDPARNTGVIILVVPKETSADGRGYLRIETGNRRGRIHHRRHDRTVSRRGDSVLSTARLRRRHRADDACASRSASRANSTFRSIAAFRRRQPPRAATRTRRRSGGIPPFVYVFILFVILSALERSWTRVDVCRSSFRSSAEDAVAGAAADSAVAAGSVVAAAVGLAASVAEAGSAAVAPADLGDAWHE